MVKRLNLIKLLKYKKFEKFNILINSTSIETDTFNTPWS